MRFPNVLMDTYYHVTHIFKKMTLIDDRRVNRLARHIENGIKGVGSLCEMFLKDRSLRVCIGN